MNTQHSYTEIHSPKTLRALNVQNALGYAGHWRMYDAALASPPVTWRGEPRYVDMQVLLAVLGELA